MNEAPLLIFIGIGLLIILSIAFSILRTFKVGKESWGYLKTSMEAAKKAQAEGKDVHTEVQKAQLEAIKKNYGGELPKRKRTDGFNTVIASAVLFLMAFGLWEFLISNLLSDLPAYILLAWRGLLFGLPVLTALYALARLIARPFAKAGFLLLFTDRASPWARLEGTLTTISFFTLFASVFGSIIYLVVKYGE